MQASPVLASPRKALSPEEKEEKYRVNETQFGKVLDDVVLKINTLMNLYKKVASAGKGNHVRCDTTGYGQKELTLKELRTLSGLLNKDVKCLKNYLKVSTRKPKKPANPESFKGTYAPIYVAEAFRNFFNRAPERFGYVQVNNQASGLLMDQLALVKQGFLLKNTATLLFFIYAKSNNLHDQVNARFIQSDDLMDESFGAAIPAAFMATVDRTYSPDLDKEGHQKLTKAGQPKIKVNKKTTSTPMNEAITWKDEAGQPVLPGGSPLSTYGVIENNYAPDQEGGFNRAKFASHFFQNILAPNCFSLKTALEAEARGDLPADGQISASLIDQGYKQNMLNEYYTVKRNSEEWRILLEPARKLRREQTKKAAGVGKKKPAKK
jgi:hypothetical protein